MKKESLEKGNKLQAQIDEVTRRISRLDEKYKTSNIDINFKVGGRVSVQDKSDAYTNKANTNLQFLNQLYRDNVLRTLENCKKDLEIEFGFLGENDSECSEEKY